VRLSPGLAISDNHQIQAAAIYQTSGSEQDNALTALRGAEEVLLQQCQYVLQGVRRHVEVRAWMRRLLKHAVGLYAIDAPVVLAGDFNVVPTDADIYPTKSYAKNALVQPEPRALFQKLLDQGWRCHPRTSPRSTDVHVLGLQAKPLGARCWSSH
jgi:exonuclease III